VKNEKFNVYHAPRIAPRTKRSLCFLKRRYLMRHGDGSQYAADMLETHGKMILARGRSWGSWGKRRMTEGCDDCEI
jgi:hypothetical protein